MKINDISVIGIYVYSDTAIYEKGDFVIDGNIMYICKSDVSGIKPPNPEYYTIYLGEQSASIEEIQDYLSGKSVLAENKYLSVKTLKSALNLVSLGLDGKGIIGNTITKTDIFMTSDFEKEGYDITKVLLEIMKDEKLNNAIFRVSRKLPELIPYVGGIESENSCILKQYTYLKEDSTDRIRVQELIDPESGLIFYRSYNIDSYSDDIEFKCAVVNSEIKKQIDFIISTYNKKLNSLKNVSGDLQKSFRFREVNFRKDDYVTLTLREGLGYIPDFGLITIIFRAHYIKEDIYKSFEISIDLTDKVDDEFPEYYVTDNISIYLEQSSASEIELNLYTEDDSNIELLINNIYYREYV